MLIFFRYPEGKIIVLHTMISYSFGKIDEMITTYFIAKGLQSVVGSELSKNTENRGFETRRVQHIRWIWCQSYVRLFV